jgi:hypothetical protein
MLVINGYNFPLFKDITMGKAKGKTSSVMGYFRELFRTHRDWLEGATNDVVLQQWKTDHPGQLLTQKIRQSMANAKSQERKKAGIVRRHKGRRRKAHAGAGETKVARVRTPVSLLEALEGAIDHSLSLARQPQLQGLEGVIKHLRLARNGVVWSLGQPTSV